MIIEFNDRGDGTSVCTACGAIVSTELTDVHEQSHMPGAPTVTALGNAPQAQRRAR